MFGVTRNHSIDPNLTELLKENKCETSYIRYGVKIKLKYHR